MSAGMVLAQNASGRSLGSLAQLLTVILLFVLVLVLAFLTTRFIARYNRNAASSCGNLEVMEAFRLSPTQVLEIVRIGERYVALAVSKDQITSLGEWSKEELHYPAEGSQDKGTDFKSTFRALLNKEGRDDDQSKGE